MSGCGFAAGAFEAHRRARSTWVALQAPRFPLALLVLRAGQAISVEAIVDALWGDNARPARRGQCGPTSCSSASSWGRRGRGAAYSRGPGAKEFAIADDVDAAEFEQLVMAGIDEPDLTEMGGGARPCAGAVAGRPAAEFAQGKADQALNHWRRLAPGGPGGPD